MVMRQLDQEPLGPEGAGPGGASMPRRSTPWWTRWSPSTRRRETGPGVDEFGSIETVKFKTDENFEQTAGFVGWPSPSPVRRDPVFHEPVSIREHGDLFRRRIDQGWIRESHGDLHLGQHFL